MVSHEIDLNREEAPGGWRLDRLEMANWGTFGGPHVHVLDPACAWSLVVGENGSGKSTVVDALRALLVPRRLLRYSFNDAAGGQKRQDRSLVSYIRGAWSTVRDGEFSDTQTRFLRKEETPSFLLAVFGNARLGASVSIAQILWVSNAKDEAHFLVAEGHKSIVEDLQVAGSGREQLRQLHERGWTVCKPASYREEFCARMGIPGDGALEIFNQAIGVKEVSDVNAFLRRHLLAPGSAEEIIRDRVIPQFANLDECWHRIQSAEAQILLLEPIVAAQARVAAAEEGRKELRDLLDALPWYYATRQATLLETHALLCQRELEALEAALGELQHRENAERARRDSLRQELDGDAAGRRLREIELDMRELKLRAEGRLKTHDQLLSMIGAHPALGPMPHDEASFLALRERAHSLYREVEKDRTATSAAESKAGLEKERTSASLSEIAHALDSLENRHALIPHDLQEIRDALCEATGIEGNALLFAGELMEVKPEYAADWAGAIERLLHSFGVSLLVPEALYPKVAPWINSRRLVNRLGHGMRLAFHRLPERAPGRPSRPEDPRAVALRLNFRHEHPAAAWVEAEVRRAFAHVCCRDTAELEKESFGITAQGLIRNGARHTKDDRRAISERMNFVLGWSPEQKRLALESERERLVGRLAELESVREEARSKVRACDLEMQALGQLAHLKAFSEIDFQTEREGIGHLVAQKSELEAVDDRRHALQKHFESCETHLVTLQKERDALLGTRGRKEMQRDDDTRRLGEVRRQLATLAPGALPELEARFAPLEERPLTCENLPEIRDAVRNSLNGRAGSFSQEINAAEKAMISPMTNFLNAYREEASLLQPRPEYAAEFCALHERLVSEALPAHKERFRDFLNDNLTQSIALLESRLDEEFKTHQARLEQVNATLVTLDYSPGTFVELDRRPTRDAAIRLFRSQLRDCLSTGLAREDEESRLALYDKIRELVTRFSKDPEWCAQVTDSRRWLDFGVRERQRADGHEVNYFDSSVGKSGGQKARLAFTMLAASLLAQYGLADDPDRSDSLRLVVVDEVFARTDEENSRRALELFKRMGFQLLVIVPWEAKARIAEDYVENFHLTLNPHGDASQLQLATRAQYDERAAG